MWEFVRIISINSEQKLLLQINRHLKTVIWSKVGSNLTSKNVRRYRFSKKDIIHVRQYILA